MTADSDLCPPIKMTLESYPEKEITVLIPPNRYNITVELRETVRAEKIKKKHLNRNLLPATIYDSDGKLISKRPKKYA